MVLLEELNIQRINIANIGLVPNLHTDLQTTATHLQRKLMTKYINYFLPLPNTINLIVCLLCRTYNFFNCYV